MNNSSANMSGVYNIMPTPFKEDETIDLQSLKSVTEFMLTSGVHGITVLGVLGEAHKLTDAERDVVLSTVIDVVDGQIPVCVGTSHASTYGCIATSERAIELGASSVMITPPKLMRPSDAAMRDHYITLANTLEAPIVIQDHPSSTGVYMSTEFLLDLADSEPSLSNIKLEDEPSPKKASDLLSQNAEMKIFGGLGGIMFMEELRHGAVGTMTGFAFPNVLVRIYDKFNDGDLKDAEELFNRYCPLISFENQKYINLPLRKQAYYRRGIIGSPTARKPHAPIDQMTLDELDKLLHWADTQGDK